MKFNFAPKRHAVAAAACAALLSACGGEQSAQGPSATATEATSNVATGSTNFSMQLAPDDAPAASAVPTYHLAPVLLDAPGDADTADANTSAHSTAHYQALPQSLQNVATRGLTLSMLRELRKEADATSATPMASSGVTTYTPAQIRAAYGLPALPASGTTPSGAQAAQLGAGQTIYLIDAYSDPNVATELAAFNTKFGLPGCTAQSISSGANLPLAVAAGNVCVFSVVNSNAAGEMTSVAPAYDSGWATEIALDVQWAHATAPLARIILINAPDPSTTSFDGAVALANAMGPGIVSMSFGADEGNWTSSASTVFSGSGMTYLASAGDSGPAVNWPAVAPNVLAVGGTSLTYSGSGTRSESAWSDTGGGISLYTAVPAYQTNAVPGVGTLSHRSVSDVAFNANPNTGQYLAVMEPGNSSVSWVSAGGTSIGSPQWAGILAVANAMRATASKTALGDPHSMLYQQIGAVSGTYASAFHDVTSGTDGTCATCSARVGYDQVTGLGTPNVASLLTVLTGSTITSSPTAPAVTGATINGQTGTALTFQVSASDANTLTYSLAGGPSGMTIGSSGIVSWAVPVAGTYKVTASAKDSKTGLSGSAVYTVVITAPVAPVVASANISGVAGAALTYAVTVTDANPVAFTLTNAPSGMSIGSSGVVSWAKPVAGKYTVTVTAKDSKTGLTGKGTLSISISAAGATGSSGTSGPQISVTSFNGMVDMPVAGFIMISDSSASSIDVNISNAPLGMMFVPSGSAIAVLWPAPAAGNYTMTITATDSNGRTAQVTVQITISG